MIGTFSLPTLEAIGAIAVTVEDDSGQSSDYTGVPIGKLLESAGTLSIPISVPAMMVGLMKYRQLGALRSVSMRGYFRSLATGSIVGALAGAAMIGLAPAAGLMILLGGLLIWSAFKAVPMHRKIQPGSEQSKEASKENK